MRPNYSLMNARYRVEGPASIPGYVRVLDLIQNKIFWGRLLPRLPSAERVLEGWTRNLHAGMVPILRYLIQEREFLAIFPDLDKCTPLESLSTVKWSHDELSLVFLRLLGAIHELRKHQQYLPVLDLGRIIWHPQLGMRLLGHEGALSFARGGQEEVHDHLDLRYAAPERLLGKPHAEPSEVFRLGALIYHFLTGNNLRSGSPYRPILEQRPKLRAGWDELLQPMLDPNPECRPRLEALWTLAQEKLGIKPGGEWLEGWTSPLDEHVLAQLIGDLLASRNQARASAIQVFPGKERVARLTPFTRLAEEQGYLVLHTWQPDPQPKPYQTINDIIQIFRLGVRMLRIKELDTELRPIAEWEDVNQITARWSDLIDSILKALIPGYYCGIVLIVEDLHNLDTASLEGLLNLCGWMKRAPFLLVVSGSTFTHSHFRALEERLNVDWRFHHPAPLSQTRIKAWASRDGVSESQRKLAMDALRDTHKQEVFFLHWLEDRIQKNNGFQRFLALCWSQLRPREQLLLKLFSLCERPISTEELELALEIRGMDPTAAQLYRFKYLRGGFMGRYQVTVPAMKRYCQLQIAHEDAKQLRAGLLTFERGLDRPDLVQMLYLALGLDLKDEVSTLAEQLRSRILERWELGLLWRMEALHRHHPKSGLKFFADLAELLSGRVLQASAVRSDELLQDWVRAANAERKGSLEDAREAWRSFAARRRLPRGLRLYLAVRQAELARLDGHTIEVLRMWRKVADANATDFDPHAVSEWRARLAAAMVGVGYYDEIRPSLTRLPTHLRAWVIANAAWSANDFPGSLKASRLAVAGLAEHHELPFRAQVFNLRGNSLYRDNQAERAAEAYREAFHCIELADRQDRRHDIRFNLASAELLAGKLISARAHFNALAEEFKHASLLFQVQVLWNQMVCALLLLDIPNFQKYHERHQELLRKLKNDLERQRGLAIRLQAALLWSHDEVAEDLDELERLMKTGSADSLLQAESAVAVRLARFVLGLPRKSEDEITPLTAWRHKLIDLLSGTELSYEDLMSDIGNGYFRAVHFLWLFGLVDNHQLPHRYFNEALATAFEQHARETGAELSAFQRRHFGHLYSRGEVPSADWDRVLSLFERMRWNDKRPRQFRADLLNTLQSCWPHAAWGISELKRKLWTPNESCSCHETANSVSLQLNQLGIGHLEMPTSIRFLSTVQEAPQSLILLPIHSDTRETLFWLVTQQNDPRVFARYEPLFRFFAKLIEWVESPVGPIPEEGPAPKSGNATRVSTNRSQSSQNGVEPFPPNENSFARFDLIGTSPVFQAACQMIARYAPSDLNIWIQGESGTGKELAARATHGLSTRVNKPFRALNCAHYPDNLVEAELFGHVRGSFTGAQSDRAGVLELVDGGTLFLDEIGDINAKVQSLLLRVVQEGEFSRVGETRVRKADIRLVCATNKNLHQMIDRGEFREDLYFRLVEVEVKMPALRERLDDLPLLIQHFIQKHAPLRKSHFEDSFIHLLNEYYWPGNVRELESYVRRILAHWPDLLKFSRLNALPFLRPSLSAAAGPTDCESEEPTLESFELANRQRLLIERLARYDGSRTKAAKSLGLSRQQLTNLIQKFGLH